MPSPVRSFQGVVLSREEKGERNLFLSMFSPKEGLVRVIKRLSGKRVSAPIPDFFDELDLRLRHPRTGGDSISFVEELRVLRRRPELAADRERLEAAFSIGRVFIENGSHLIEPAPYAELLQLSLDALSRGFPPSVVLMKTIYRFARVEGFPVKEDWWENLSLEDKALATKILNIPIRDLVPDNDSPAPLLESLRTWINTETEMRC